LTISSTAIGLETATYGLLLSYAIPKLRTVEEINS
jgi:hypothetical protein